MTTAVTIQRDEVCQSRNDLVQIRRGFQPLDHELIDLSLLRRIHVCNRRRCDFVQILDGLLDGLQILDRLAQ